MLNNSQTNDTFTSFIVSHVVLTSQNINIGVEAQKGWSVANYMSKRSLSIQFSTVHPHFEIRPHRRRLYPGFPKINTEGIGKYGYFFRSNWRLIFKSF